MKKKLISSIVLFILLLLNNLLAENIFRNGSLSGHVYKYNTDIPIENVQVYFQEYETYTDENGYFEITSISAGTYTIFTESDYYFSSETPDVIISNGENSVLDIELLWSEIEVDPTCFMVNLPHGSILDEVLILTNDGPGELLFNCSFEETARSNGERPVEVSFCPEVGVVDPYGGQAVVIVTFDGTNFVYGESFMGNIYIENNSNYQRGDDYIIPVTGSYGYEPYPNPATNGQPVGEDISVDVEELSWQAPLYGVPPTLYYLTLSDHENLTNPILNDIELYETAYNLDYIHLDYNTNYWVEVVTSFVNPNTGEQFNGPALLWNFWTEEWVDINNNDIIKDISFLQNHPNPFKPAVAGRSPSTTISFALSHPKYVELVIYNIRGQQIRTLVNENYTAGTHSILWNGRDDMDQFRVRDLSLSVESG